MCQIVTCPVCCEHVASENMAQKRKSFDLTYKLNAVASAEKNSKEAAAREFGVDAKNEAYDRQRCLLSPQP